MHTRVCAFVAITAVLLCTARAHALERWCDSAETTNECGAVVTAINTQRPCLFNGTGYDTDVCSTRVCTGDEQLALCGRYSHACEALCVYDITLGRYVCTPRVARGLSCSDETPRPSRFCSGEEMQSVPSLNYSTDPRGAMHRCRVVCDDALLTVGCQLQTQNSVSGVWSSVVVAGESTRACTQSEYENTCADSIDACTVVCNGGTCTVLSRCYPSAVFAPTNRVPAAMVLGDVESSAQCGPGWASDPERNPCRAISCEYTHARGFFNCTCDVATCGCPNRWKGDTFACAAASGDYDTDPAMLGLGGPLDAAVYCGTYARRARVSCVAGVCSLVPNTCVCKTNVHPFGGKPCGGTAAACTREETLQCGPGVSQCVFVHARGLYVTPTRPSQDGEYTKCTCGSSDAASGTRNALVYEGADPLIPGPTDVTEAQIVALASRYVWAANASVLSAPERTFACPRTASMYTGAAGVCVGGTGLFVSGGALSTCICNPVTSMYVMGINGYPECIDIPRNSTHLLLDATIERRALTVVMPPDADIPQLATELCSYRHGCALNVTSAYAKPVRVTIPCSAAIAVAACGNWFEPEIGHTCAVDAWVFPPESSRASEAPVVISGTEVCTCESDPVYVDMFDPVQRRPCHAASYARVPCTAAMTQLLCDIPPLGAAHSEERFIDLPGGVRVDVNAAGYAIDRCAMRPLAPPARRLVDGSCPGDVPPRPCNAEERDSFCGGGECWAQCRNASLSGAGNCTLWGVCPSPRTCPDGQAALLCNNRNRDNDGCTAVAVQARFGEHVRTQMPNGCNCRDGFSGPVCASGAPTRVCPVGSTEALQCGPPETFTSCTYDVSGVFCACASGFSHSMPPKVDTTVYDSNVHEMRTTSANVHVYGQCEAPIVDCGSNATRIAGVYALGCTAACPGGDVGSSLCRLVSWTCNATEVGLSEATSDFQEAFDRSNTDRYFVLRTRPCDRERRYANAIAVQTVHNTVAQAMVAASLDRRENQHRLRELGITTYFSDVTRTSEASALTQAVRTCGIGFMSAVRQTTDTVTFTIDASSCVCKTSTYTSYQHPVYGYQPCGLQYFTVSTDCDAYDNAVIDSPCKECADATALTRAAACNTPRVVKLIADVSPTKAGYWNALGLSYIFKRAYMMTGRENTLITKDSDQYALGIELKTVVSPEIAKFVCGDYVAANQVLTCTYSTDANSYTTAATSWAEMPLGIEPTCKKAASECVCQPGASAGADGRPCSRNYRVRECDPYSTEPTDYCNGGVDGCTLRIDVNGKVTTPHACGCRSTSGTRLSPGLRTLTRNGVQYVIPSQPDYFASDTKYFLSCRCNPGDPACDISVSSCVARRLCGVFAAGAYAKCTNNDPDKCVATGCICAPTGARMPNTDTTRMELSCAASTDDCTAAQVTANCPPIRDATGYATSVYTTCKMVSLPGNSTQVFVTGSCGSPAPVVRSCATDSELRRSCGAGATSCLWDTLTNAPIANTVTRACVCGSGYFWNPSTNMCSSVMLGEFGCTAAESNRCPTSGIGGCRKRTFRMESTYNALSVGVVRTIQLYLQSTGSYPYMSKSTMSATAATIVATKDVSYIECRCTHSTGSSNAQANTWVTEIDAIVRNNVAASDSTVVSVTAPIAIVCPGFTKSQIFNYEILYGHCPGIAEPSGACNGRGSCVYVSGDAVNYGVSDTEAPLVKELARRNGGPASGASPEIVALADWLIAPATSLGSSFSNAYLLSQEVRNLTARFPAIFARPTTTSLIENPQEVFDIAYTTPAHYRTVAFVVACDFATSTSANTAVQRQWLNPHTSGVPGWKPWTTGDLLTAAARAEARGGDLPDMPASAETDFLVRLGHVTGSRADGIGSPRYAAWTERVPWGDTCPFGKSFFERERELYGAVRDGRFYLEAFRAVRKRTTSDTQGGFMEGSRRAELAYKVAMAAYNDFIYANGPAASADGSEFLANMDTGRNRDINYRYGEARFVNSPCKATSSQPLERTGGYMHLYGLSQDEVYRSLERVPNNPENVPWRWRDAAAIFAVNNDSAPTTGKYKTGKFGDYYPWSTDFKRYLDPRIDSRFQTQCEQVHSNECSTQVCARAVFDKARQMGRHKWYESADYLDDVSWSNWSPFRGTPSNDYYRNGTRRYDINPISSDYVHCPSSYGPGGDDDETIGATPPRFLYDRNGMPCRSPLFGNDGTSKEKDHVRWWCHCRLTVSPANDAGGSVFGYRAEDSDFYYNDLGEDTDDTPLSWDRTFGYYPSVVPAWDGCSDTWGQRYRLHNTLIKVAGFRGTETARQYMLSWDNSPPLPYIDSLDWDTISGAERNFLRQRFEEINRYPSANTATADGVYARAPYTPMPDQVLDVPLNNPGPTSTGWGPLASWGDTAIDNTYVYEKTSNRDLADFGHIYTTVTTTSGRSTTTTVTADAATGVTRKLLIDPSTRDLFWTAVRRFCTPPTNAWCNAGCPTSTPLCNVRKCAGTSDTHCTTLLKDSNFNDIAKLISHKGFYELLKTNTSAETILSGASNGFTGEPFTYVSPPPQQWEKFKISNCDLTAARGALFGPFGDGGYNYPHKRKVNNPNVKPFLDGLNKLVCTDQEVLATLSGSSGDRCPVGSAHPSSSPRAARDDLLAALYGNPASKVYSFQGFTPAMCFNGYIASANARFGERFVYNYDPRAARMSAIEGKTFLGVHRDNVDQAATAPYTALRGHARAYSMAADATSSSPRMLATLVAWYTGDLYEPAADGARFNVMRHSPLYLHHYGAELHPQSTRTSASQSGMQGTSAFGFSRATMYDWAAGHTARTPYSTTKFPFSYAYTSSDVQTPRRCYTIADIGAGSRTTRGTQTCACSPGFKAATVANITQADGQCAASVSPDSDTPHYPFDSSIEGYCLRASKAQCEYNPNWNPRAWCKNGRYDPTIHNCVCDAGWKTVTVQGQRPLPCNTTVPPCDDVACVGEGATVDLTTCTCKCAPVGPFASTFGPLCQYLFSNYRAMASARTPAGAAVYSMCSFQGSHESSGTNVSCACFAGSDGGKWTGASCDVPQHNAAFSRECVANGGTVAVNPLCVSTTAGSNVINDKVQAQCPTVPFSVCNCASGSSRFGRTCQNSRCPIGRNGAVCSGVGTCTVGADGIGTCACDLPCDRGTGSSLTCAAALSQLRAGNMSAIPWWGGCACETNLRLFCAQPNSTTICNGYDILASDSVSRELSKCVPVGAEVGIGTLKPYACMCNRSGELTTKGTYCSESICPSGPTGGPCSGRTCNTDGTCDCNSRRAELGSPSVRMGRACETLAPACEGASVGGVPSVCNNRGVCAATNAANTSYACTCARGYSGAQCQITDCLVPCGAGTCGFRSGSTTVRTCICTNPAVINKATEGGSCTVNACLYGATPSADNSTCVCPLEGQDYELGCRLPPCPRDPASGYYCGPLHALDGPNGDKYPYASLFKQCVKTAASDGCACGQGYVKSTTTLSCDFLCNVNNTATFTIGGDGVTKCTCKPGWTGERCLTRVCPEEAVFNASATAAADRCICPNTFVFYGGACVKTNCTVYGEPARPGDIVVDCSSGLCRNVVLTAFCKCARGWTNATCADSVCRNGGSWDTSINACRCTGAFTGPTCTAPRCTSPTTYNATLDTCVCPSRYSGTNCARISCGAWGTNDPTDESRCVCEAGATGQFCDTLSCPGGSRTVLSTGEVTCVCPVDYSIVKSPTGVLSCANILCGPGGTPAQLSNGDTCACNDTYEFKRNTVYRYYCVPACGEHGAPSASALGECVCESGYTGARCSTPRLVDPTPVYVVNVTTPVYVVNVTQGTPNTTSTTNTTTGTPPDPVVEVDPPPVVITPTPTPDSCSRNATCLCLKYANCSVVVTPPVDTVVDGNDAGGGGGVSTATVGGAVGGSVAGALAIAIAAYLRFHR